MLEVNKKVYEYRKVILDSDGIIDARTARPLGCPWGGYCSPDCVAFRVKVGKALCVAGPKGMVIGIVTVGTTDADVNEVIESDEEDEVDED